MIQRTFQLIPGVGPWREKDLWANGIQAWNEFPSSGVCMSAKLDGKARERLAAAKDAFDRDDLPALAQMIPPREHWRLYRHFAKEAVFFDIETEGREDPTPTVVSLLRADGSLESFILGRNLDALPQALEGPRLWVSFNGTCYDEPILRRYFGDAFPKPALHLDLRFIYRRLGFSCGLKTLEEKLGIGRPPHLKGVNGWDAVLLWRAYRTQGSLEALRFLVEYNLYDAFQLRTLMDLAYIRATESLGFQPEPAPVFERGDILYDVSRLLLSLSPTSADMALLERLRGQDRQLEEM